MEGASEETGDVAFGRFRVFPYRRELLADGQPIKIGGRAFDVLMALIEARGAVISKGALMARVWPDRVVEENNLQYQISTLRAAFGAERDLIRTVSGRGYQFTGEIQTLPKDAAEPSGPSITAAQPVAAAPALTNLPQPVSELIGRDDKIAELLSLAAAHRLVTLTGAGGIGKTRLALAAARRLLPQFADGVWIADLAPLADPALVPTAVAASLGLELVGAVSPEAVANALSGKHLLLVLDNSEHVIGAAATMAEALLHANPAAHAIATSREPLKAEGEWVYPVPPLTVPPKDAEDTDDPLRYGAVRLFLDRARAAEPNFAPDRRSAAAIAAICWRLDGIPLAIELAAARAAALGVEELAARLDHRFDVLIGGRRTALPRHQTLRATLDWSYELLAESERVILRRLAVFAGVFSLEAAGAVVADTEITSADVVDSLASLATKSLVETDFAGTAARYRLLDTTRAYAREKLGESGDCDRLARRHAEYYRDFFEQAETEWEGRPAAELLADYGRQVDNLRAALDWAFSPNGNTAIGVSLTAAAEPLWTHLSLLEECRGRVERALAALAVGANRDARREMKLHVALAASLIHTRGGAGPEIGATWTKALEIAESLDDTEYQLRSLWGLWFFHSSCGRHRIALELAQRFCTLAAKRPDHNDRPIGGRLIGFTQHCLGDQVSARRHLERALADHVTADHRSRFIGFQLDQRTVARALLARILWLGGFPDQAMRTAERAVEDARAANHATSLCYALGLAACPIALLVGDLAAAADYVGMLLDHSRRHALPVWHAWGRSHQGVLVIHRGDLNTGLSLLCAGFDDLGETRSALRFLTFVSEIAEALGRAGQIADGLALIDEAIDRCQSTEEHWVTSELLRIKGELVLLQGAEGAAAVAEDHFRQADDWARRQGALSWELRAATSLARLWRDQGRPADAMALLQPVYDRFTEGFDTADLEEAKALLQNLG